MMYGLRNTAIEDILTKNSALWKDVVVNSVLAVVLTVKIAQFAPSLTFLDHFWGLAIFSLFAATFNTEKNTREEVGICF